MKLVKNALDFEWDKGNTDKNQTEHGVSNKETEESFFDKKKQTFPDVLHSGKEERMRIIGKTEQGRLLFVVYTMRGKSIRIISARNVNKKEVSLYEKGT